MTTTAQRTTVSPHIEREARRLLELRDQWRWARNRQTGVAFIAIPSPCHDKRCKAGPDEHSHIRHVHPFGRGCDCPAMIQWNSATCKHCVAVQLANAEDAAAEAPSPASLPTHGRNCLTDRDAQAVVDAIMAESRRPTYEALFGRICDDTSCTDDAQDDSAFCRRHQLVDAF